jgi:hypothetical protein
MTRADLKTFYRSGFFSGLSRENEPTLEEIDEEFESAYKRWRERKKETVAANSVNPDVVYERWLAGVPGAQPPLFKPDELPKRQK